MTRCPHCNKFLHNEHLTVLFKKEDYDKVCELMGLIGWTPKYLYSQTLLQNSHANDVGMLKCGDIYIHFVMQD